MKSALKITLLCLIFLLALTIRSEYIREDGKYLLGADPYYHYRMAETILDQGTRPEWDYTASWPTGQPVTYPPLFQYYLAYSFKIIGDPLGFSLFTWCIYAGIIPLFFCIVLMVLIGTFITNQYGGFLAAFVFATIPAVTMRTLIGFTDTDTFVLLFSLFVTLLFILTVKNEDKPKDKNDNENKDKNEHNNFDRYNFFNLLKKYNLRQPFLAFMCGFSLFLFSMTWNGYWYMLLLLSASFTIWVLQKREKTRIESLVAFLVGFTAFFSISNSVYLEGVLLLAIFLFYELSSQYLPILKKYLIVPHILSGILLTLSIWVIYSQEAVSKAFGFLSLVTTPESNVFASALAQMIIDNFDMTPRLAWELLGPALILAPLGIFFLVKKKKVWLSAFLLFYLTGTALMLLRGGRFSLLMAIPLCLGTTIFVVECAHYLKKKTKKAAAVAVTIVFLTGAVQLAYSEKVNSGPEFMTDDLWNALQWIDTNTPPESVVIGHWGLGYLIESVGKRRSVMNGNHYDSFWRLVKFSTIVTTDTEEVAVKEIYGFDTASEVENVRTFSQDPDTAQQQMQAEMTPFAENDAYVIIDEYTAITLDWWSLYGTWNYSTQRGQQFFYNVAFLTSGKRVGKAVEYKYQSERDLILLYKTEDGFHSFVFQKNQVVPTDGTIFFKNGEKYYFVREEGTYGIIFLPYSEEKHEGEDLIFQYMSIYVLGVPQQLNDIMLTTLYFLDGDELNYFELVKEYGTVKIYKVHKVPRAQLNEGPIKVVDEFTPVAVQ